MVRTRARLIKLNSLAWSVKGSEYPASPRLLGLDQLEDCALELVARGTLHSVCALWVDERLTCKLYVAIVDRLAHNAKLFATNSLSWLQPCCHKLPLHLSVS